ncbi:ABC transporter ATP-binding protein [Aliiroseovarius sp. KMU-71]|jgi:capsular polysaccharide transport system ATP-binding protein|uniref:ABC transporter ATP-binding protein n=1 Tax=Aliiroseovarius sp. KMU-71 TaxID=3453123 RepID=UPI003F4751F7
MIELVGVSKSYSLKGVHKLILDDVSYAFPSRRNIAIMGRNGAGKSTLMRMLAGTELPDRGRIIRDIKVSWPMGFSAGFNGTMTGLENVRFVARVYGADTEYVIDYVDQFAELGPSLALPISTYSSGMKARLAFGLSLAIDFDCYLIDEITAVGDRRFKMKSQAAFDTKLGRSNVIMISHSEAAIRSYCDAGLLLLDGALYYYDDIATLVADYKKFVN